VCSVVGLIGRHAVKARMRAVAIVSIKCKSMDLIGQTSLIGGGLTD
jgi:hypothetical protein